MLMGNQVRLLKSKFFGVLVQIFREGARARNTFLQMSEKQKEARRRFLLAMTEGQEIHSKEVLSSVFTAWFRHLGELRKDKKTEKKMMGLLGMNQGRIVLLRVVGNWVRAAKASRADWKKSR